MKWITFLLLLHVIMGCDIKKGSTKEPEQEKSVGELVLSEKQALRLSKLPLKCLQQEYPNKLGQVLNSHEELNSPKNLHPTFYGCFDWHSSVHGHWLLVRLLKEYPGLENNKEIRAILNTQLTKENIRNELEFFKTKYNESFERTYGWAWLLKLQEELITWKDHDAKKWATNLQPLTNYIVEKYMQYLPKLVYPIRTGEHINTAFGLAFAYDYAFETKNKTFLESLTRRAKEFYLQDKNYPVHIEPSGYDFLSPTFEEIDLMRRVLSTEEFSKWLKDFLPDLGKKSFKLEVGKVIDRSDGKLVHLDGLNFSRAWCMYGLANNYPKYAHLKELGDIHLNYSLSSITDGDYMGEHWLASFALYALLERKK